MSSRLQSLGKLEAKVVCQYVWGARKGHRDELILRDRDVTASSSESSGEFLNERLWCLMDYYDPTSLVDNSGSVVERYRFSAFGLRTVMSAGFTPLDTSGYDWDFAFKGQFLDLDTGYYNYGYRYYSPELGRWLSRDPIQEKGGNKIYTFVSNNPINKIDKIGLIEYTDCRSCYPTGASKVTQEDKDDLGLEIAGAIGGHTTAAWTTYKICLCEFGCYGAFGLTSRWDEQYRMAADYSFYGGASNSYSGIGSEMVNVATMIDDMLAGALAASYREQVINFDVFCEEHCKQLSRDTLGGVG